MELGIFTNDSYKEISAVIFSTTGIFGKAVVESGIDRFIRATHYRQMSKEKFFLTEGLRSLGISHYYAGPSNYQITTRYNFGDTIIGADLNIYHSRHHRETHLDGLHIYYNPYATIPFEMNVMHPKEITHNFYDIGADIPDQRHPDGALVSRQLYEPAACMFENLVKLHRNYGSCNTSGKR